jgi:glycosyltransferase involved in cell wall biosynthesis
MRISLVMLTYNRADLVERVMAHNLANAGSQIDELIWVDNGSTDRVHDVMQRYQPDVSVLNRRNVGIFKGYNRGFILATGDFVMITDDDMLMPAGWLAAYRRYLTQIPETGVATILWKSPRPKVSTTRIVNGLECHPCGFLGRFIVSRELLIKKIGLLREDFGLIGPGDVEWSRRAIRICKAEGLLVYAIAGMESEHLGTPEYDGEEYFAFKVREAHDPRKRSLLRFCEMANYPYYNPYK